MKDIFVVLEKRELINHLLIDNNLIPNPYSPYIFQSFQEISFYLRYIYKYSFLWISMVDKEILKKKDSIIELCNKYSILYFSVFGSRATNSFNKNSDYDFAYYGKKRLSKKINLNC